MYFETLVIKLRHTHSAGLMIVNKDVVLSLLFCYYDCFKRKSKYITKHLMHGPSGNYCS